jgi:hypothetical protein
MTWSEPRTSGDLPNPSGNLWPAPLNSGQASLDPDQTQLRRCHLALDPLQGTEDLFATGFYGITHDLSFGSELFEGTHLPLRLIPLSF